MSLFQLLCQKMYQTFGKRSLDYVIKTTYTKERLIGHDCITPRMYYVEVQFATPLLIPNFEYRAWMNPNSTARWCFSFWCQWIEEKTVSNFEKYVDKLAKNWTTNPTSYTVGVKGPPWLNGQSKLVAQTDSNMYFKFC